MKNVIKKISAIAMAFTLLGTGTAITKSISPNSESFLTAEAYSKNNVYLSNETFPSGKLTQGKSFGIKGIIHSKNEITKVYGGVYYRNEDAPRGKEGLRKTDQYFEIDKLSLNYKNDEYLYDLSGAFNKNIMFGKLSAGQEYTYSVFVEVVNDSSPYNLVNSDFTICSSSSSPDVFKDFTDVEYDWYSGALLFVYDRKIMNGKGASPQNPTKKIFDPRGKITRAEIAQVLYNHMGCPAVNTSNLPFSDMKRGEWYVKAVCWANQSGVVKGYPDGKFGINYPITREELIQMLYNYAKFRKYKSVDERSDFIDVCNEYDYTDQADVSPWAKEAVAWAIDKDVIDIENQDINYRRIYKIDPQKMASRAECAQLLKNLLENARY